MVLTKRVSVRSVGPVCWSGVSVRCVGGVSSIVKTCQNSRQGTTKHTGVDLSIGHDAQHERHIGTMRSPF